MYLKFSNFWGWTSAGGGDKPWSKNTNKCQCGGGERLTKFLPDGGGPAPQEKPCSIDHCVKLIVADKNLSEICSYFALKWFLLNSFGDMCFLESKFNVFASFCSSTSTWKKKRFWHFWEHPLYHPGVCFKSNLNWWWLLIAAYLLTDCVIIHS